MSGPVPTKKWSVIGPGLVAAATGVGSGDLVATLIAGQKYGYALLWACIAGSIIKIILVEGVGRYTLATGNSMFHGWRTLGAWTTWYFVPYIVIWGFVYGAAAMSASAMPLKALFPDTSLAMWAVATGVLGFAFTWLGNYRIFEKVIAVLVGIMFLTVCGIATLSLRNLPEILSGLVPSVPDGSFLYVLSLAGGVGGTITLAAYGYWLTEKNWRGPAWMRVMRLDNTVAYVVTGIFVAAMLLIGADLLYSANIAVSQGDRGLLDLADVLSSRYGPTTATVFLLGFWAAAFSSVLGVWNGVSLMFADFVGHLRGLRSDDPRIHVGGRYYRLYLIWLTFPPMLLFFLGKPTALVIAYGVLGSLFMPFLALTLILLLNSAQVPARWRNGWATNIVMAIVSLLFISMGVVELAKIVTG
ncbi:Nramp family divalent metal transporter [Corynebacterium liangguodongii]|uniref:Nramp family divalent metal transporter n=1 Tax=Corynebacterium liangguodongii TaxID=2079535 RepID=UPI0018EEB80B|nr:Nramp family divalent metal transporter [Corynebacterium liangguodongii]